MDMVCNRFFFYAYFTGGDRCSEAFWETLSVLGNMIDIDGWTKYTGDMKVKN